MRAQLHFDKVAPGGVTLPFLLASPFFGAVAAGLLLLAGEGLLVTRWHPMLIGALHVYTIGFLLFAIAGALLQIGPVVTARTAPRNRHAPALLRLALGGGALLFGCGLFHGLRALLVPAVILLAVALPAWLFTAARGLGVSHRSRDLLIALAGLSAGMLLGLRLAIGHAFPETGLPRQYTDLHAGWMLFGGIAPLIMAVGSIVIPMFQHTRPLPRATKLLPALSVAGLLVASIPGFMRIGGAVSVLSLIAFACIVLIAHARRRSRAPDATVQLFQLAMWSAIGGVLLLGAAVLLPAWQSRLQWSGGALLIAGFAGSAVHAMSLKIVPFLVRLRLQRTLWKRGLAATSLPGFMHLLPQEHARMLPLLQAGAVAALALAGITQGTWLFHCAAVLLAAAQITLGLLLWAAALRGLRAGAELLHAGATVTFKETTT